MPFDLSPGAAAWMALVSLGAAWVRGYSGFGFAALVVSGAALVTDPRHAIGIVILADIAMTAGQLPGLRPHIDWGRAGALALGALPTVPVGIWAVQALGEDASRAATSLVILLLCGVLWAGWHMARPAGRAAHVATGVASGLAQGGAVGGLPVAAFFAAQPMPAARFRATIVAYFCLLDLWTLPTLWLAGGVTGDTLLATAVVLPVMVLGLRLGSRRFHAASPESFRRFAILLLAGLALLGLLKALA